MRISSSDDVCGLFWPAIGVAFVGCLTDKPPSSHDMCGFCFSDSGHGSVPVFPVFFVFVFIVFNVVLFFLVFCSRVFPFSFFSRVVFSCFVFPFVVVSFFVIQIFYRDGILQPILSQRHPATDSVPTTAPAPSHPATEPTHTRHPTQHHR